MPTAAGSTGSEVKRNIATDESEASNDSHAHRYDCFERAVFYAGSARLRDKRFPVVIYTTENDRLFCNNPTTLRKDRHRKILLGMVFKTESIEQGMSDSRTEATQRERKAIEHQRLRWQGTPASAFKSGTRQSGHRNTRLTHLEVESDLGRNYGGRSDRWRRC
jgi:hypothetical protein